MFYSKSTSGFYDMEIHGEAIPDDVVEITEEEWRDLLQAQTEGKSITYDSKKKKPVATEPLPPSIEILRGRMVVSRGQGRIALHRAGKLEAVEAYIEQAKSSNDPQTLEIAIAYEDALSWSRTSATTAALQQVLGLSDEETDDLFRAAALIEY